MIKKAVVEEGITPSVVSGKPSTMIKNGEAITKDEKKDLPKFPSIKIKS